jgi:hypothetical protein
METGALGEGPGEYRFPHDAAFVSDTEIAGVAPTLMRLTVVTATGRYLRSFSTTGLGGRAVGPLGGGRIAAGGIAIGAERPELLAVFDRQGNRTRMRLRGPRLLQEYPLLVGATTWSPRRRAESCSPTVRGRGYG